MFTADVVFQTLTDWWHGFLMTAGLAGCALAGVRLRGWWRGE